MMADKTAMLEKQQEQFEKNADQNSRYFALQQEVEGLRRAVGANDNANVESSNADKQTIAELKVKNQELLEKVVATQEDAESAREKAASHLSSAQDSLLAANDKLTSQMTSYEDKLTLLHQQLSEKQDEISALQSQAASAPAAVTAAPTLEEMLKTDAVIAHIEVLLAQERAKAASNMEQLKAELKDAVATAAAATADAEAAIAAASAGGGVSSEKIKELVSDVYSKMVDLLGQRAHVMEEESGEPARFEQKDVVKITRIALKQVSQDHSS
jgi:chromosome segregation ATPase